MEDGAGADGGCVGALGLLAGADVVVANIQQLTFVKMEKLFPR